MARKRKAEPAEPAEEQAPDPEPKNEPKKELSREEYALRGALAAISARGFITQIDRALPDVPGLTSERFLTAVGALLRRELGKPENRSLLFCSKTSVLVAIVQAAELGLLPGTAGEAWILPYKGEAQMQPSVWGWVELAKRSGLVLDLWAEPIYEADRATVRGGPDRCLEVDVTESWHLQPGDPIDQGGRGKRLGVYAVAVLHDGSRSWILVPERDVQTAREQNQGQSPAWKYWPDEMAKKVALKRGLKTWARGAVSLVQQASEIEDERAVSAAVESAVRTVLEADGEAKPEPRQPGQAAAQLLRNRALGAKTPSAAEVLGVQDQREPEPVPVADQEPSETDDDLRARGEVPPSEEPPPPEDPDQREPGED